MDQPESTVFARALGALTAAFGAAVLIAPQVLAKPCGLTTPTGEVEPGMRAVLGGLGARDVVLGVAVATTPAGSALRRAVTVRVACDITDAVVFGLRLPDRTRARVAALTALGWAALGALSTFPARRRTG